MSKIRVLIVDDAVVIRRLVADCLSQDPEIEVAGTAANGQIGLAKIAQVNPDLVTLDVEMPVMDGLQTLAEIRKSHPKLPVVMFSTLTERGAASTLDALALGASDYVTKPSNVGSVAVAVQRIREELIPKIKGLCRQSASPTFSEGILARGICQPRGAVPARVEIVTIGVSTGGPAALSTLLPLLARDLPVPVVLVQHMPPLFTRLLAERLTSISGHLTREGEAGALLEPSQVWIAPGGLHMEVQQGGEGVRLRTHQGPPENSCRPAVDVLFRSVAHVYGSCSLAVVLTGMGQDGLRGCESIREAGGQVLVQDESTSVVWGMPGAVSQAGLADKVLPLRELADEINRRVKPGALSVEAFNRPSLTPGPFR
ncbi:MAG TPA: chemotaxis response regulator protein-glutamate methylesterase [Verrucomicrobiae bacterium]|nr:chemotaxis response regulator protein-glutamate methylesterase [Verrucomicrobiae bacterium]